MPKFAVRFCLESRPGEYVVEYVIEAIWEEDAMTEAHERWMVEYPDDATQPFQYSSTPVK